MPEPKSQCCGAEVAKDAPERSGYARVRYTCGECGRAGAYTDVVAGAGV